MSFQKYLKESDPLTHQSNADPEVFKYNNPDDVDDIADFWVVTKPTNVSRIVDILFRTTVKGLMQQAKGGLNLDHIIAITPDYEKALKVGQDILNKVGQGDEEETKIDIQGEDNE